MMKYLLLSLISAVLLSVSWPTFGVPFFIFFALIPLLLMEHELTLFSSVKKKSLAIFFLSYLCFMVWNLVTTSWLYESRNPDGSHAIFAVVFPVLVNSLLYALVFLLYHLYKRKQGTYWGLFFLLALWISFEKFHLSWEFTWPWLNLGNVFSDYPQFVQWYDIFGATGGSLWILGINLFIFYSLRLWQAGRITKTLVKNAVILVLIIGLPMFYSLIKYRLFDAKPIGEVNVLMLQPKLDPYTEKYSKTSEEILNDLLNLAKTVDNAQIDYYISPETSLPGNGSIDEVGIDSNPIILEIQKKLKEKNTTVWAAGISSHRFFMADEPKPDEAYPLPAGNFAESFNTAIQIAPNKPVEIYHKGKLVPGVEIFPYIHLLKPILGDAMLNLGGAVVSLGASAERFNFKSPVSKGIMAPIICYESIYGEYVTEYVKKGANFLAIMTNDSWWGDTQGYKQLLSYARIRAIETRREIARSANSGVSAHINAKGDVVESTLYNDKTTLFAKIKLYDEQTIYVKIGDFISRICIFLLGFFIFYPFLKKIINKLTVKRV